MPIRARVRGIYSTAISKILNDNGVELVDVTPVIAERLGIDERRGLPADVTVKSDENNPSQILILGFPREVDVISSILESNIPDLIIYKPRIGLYAAFKARVVGRDGRECIAETPVGPAALVDEPECREGMEIPVTVVKVAVKPSEKTVVSSRVRVVGKYAIVGRGSGVSFSNFIRNKERISKLLEVSAKYVRQGFSIRWRSNADEANLDDVVNEVPELIRKLNNVELLLMKAKPLEIVYVGEYMRLLELTYNSKMYLDNIRKNVAPTTPYHHVLRSDNGRSEGVVDLLDIIAKDITWDKLKVWVRDWIAYRLNNRKDITLVHKRIMKKDVILGRAKPIEVKTSLGRLEVVLKRSMKGGGLYDGLNLPKETGDYAITSIREGDWYIIHQYYSKDGELKGIYININTPPEIMPSGQVGYTDLEVDLVYDSNGCRLIDTQGYISLLRNDYLSTSIQENVILTIDKLINELCRD